MRTVLEGHYSEETAEEADGIAHGGEQLMWFGEAEEGLEVWWQLRIQPPSRPGLPCVPP